MREHTRMGTRLHDGRSGSLGDLIHAAVRRAIEVAVDAELTAALGVAPYERCDRRCGYRNGSKARALTGPTGPLALVVPRARLVSPAGPREWASTLLPRYQRRLREVNEAVVATYLAGANTRRLRGAFGPLLRAAPLSRAPSRGSWGRSRRSSRPGAPARWRSWTSSASTWMPWRCGSGAPGRL